MTARTTVRLPEDLLARPERRAARDGRSLAELIEDGLRRVTSDRSPSKPSPRVMPPVSAAKRGLLPGIEFDDSATLQETEDHERLRHSR